MQISEAKKTYMHSTGKQRFTLKNKCLASSWLFELPLQRARKTLQNDEKVPRCVENTHTNASDASTTRRSPLHLKPFRVLAFCTQTISSKHFHIHYRGVSCHTARDTPRWHARLGPL